MPDYSQGKVYKIVNSVNKTIYIGSTCQTLSTRISKHRSNARCEIGSTPFHAAMRLVGIEKFRIILLCRFPCTSRDELNAEEFRITNKEVEIGTQVYNADFDGKPSPQTREKISQAMKSKVGEKNNNFKRGSIRFSPRDSAWTFQWLDNGRFKSKSFSANKFGDSAAHAFALIAQDEVYPKVEEDDTELIEEIRARMQ